MGNGLADASGSHVSLINLLELTGSVMGQLFGTHIVNYEIYPNDIFM